MSQAIVQSESNNGVTAATSRSDILYTPRVDLVESADSVVLYADMPGVSAESVDITLDKNVLTINGTVSAPTLEGYRLIHREYRPGVYSRQFSLSDGIDTANIAAEMNHGVLRLVLPKAPQMVARRIAVTNSA